MSIGTSHPVVPEMGVDTQDDGNLAAAVGQGQPARHQVFEAAEIKSTHLENLDPEYIHQQEISAEFFFLFVVLLQIAIYIFYRKYPERFKEVTFVLLWLYPLSVAHKNHETVTLAFFCVWVAWSVKTGYLMKKALERPLAPLTPEEVYTWFLRNHSVCYYTAGITVYFLFIIPGPAILTIFFCLYFGVLGRDCAEICATRISNTIGYAKYDSAPENICALCNVELRATLELMLGEAREEDQPAVIQLACKHEFHEKCIRGWSIVGKKDTCPFCFEKVDIRTLIPESPWNSKTLSAYWVRLLSVVRYLLVWNPIVSYSSIVFLQLFHFEPIRDSHGKPIY